ncbi:hypothetical protein BV25DRAFT_1826219 [Artomyces pyxidatus]|uniref:Uncharacterized protein n=1 Tax=Artomyces pyxidatus TaxID=48021 RepID=A0ACB8T0G5_9AGAM|nr:hypothetical protein BV25DRAFT_1826219 [Artomyces pyxidatus]
MSGPVVPFELHPGIIEWVYRSHWHQGLHRDYVARCAYATLSACSLVCKAWRPVAQCLLFRRIPRLLTAYQALRFIASLRSNQRLGTHVRSLQILELTRTDWPKRTPLVNIEHAISILELCPQVLDICLLFSAKFTSYDFFRIRSLDLHPTRLQFLIMTPQFYEIASLWPTVRFMTCGEDDDPLPSAPTQPAPFTLESLQVVTSLPQADLRRTMTVDRSYLGLRRNAPP